MNGKLLLALLILVIGFHARAMHFRINGAVANKDPDELESILKEAKQNSTTLGNYLFHDELTSETAQILIDYGARLDCNFTRKGRTPLFKACKRRDVALVALFLKYNIDHRTPDPRGRTAIDEANGDPEILTLFAKQTLLHLVKETGAGNIVTLLRNREIWGTFRAPQ